MALTGETSSAVYNICADFQSFWRESSLCSKLEWHVAGFDFTPAASIGAPTPMPARKRRWRMLRLGEAGRVDGKRTGGERRVVMEGRGGWVLVVRGDVQQALGGRLNQNKLGMFDRRLVRNGDPENGRSSYGCRKERRRAETELDGKLRTNSIGDIYAAVRAVRPSLGIGASCNTTVMLEGGAMANKAKSKDSKEPNEREPPRLQQSVEGFSSLRSVSPGQVEEKSPANFKNQCISARFRDIRHLEREFARSCLRSQPRQ
ncbi:hypothetical protein B0H14DRAFT_2568902 [Mycena olivaceomarginata]|nr:hypothetical protein B0H14DRAFT_2568902 [Mycena olivaceomarginata]